MTKEKFHLVKQYLWIILFLHFSHRSDFGPYERRYKILFVIKYISVITGESSTLACMLLFYPERKYNKAKIYRYEIVSGIFFVLIGYFLESLKFLKHENTKRMRMSVSS